MKAAFFKSVASQESNKSLKVEPPSGLWEQNFVGNYCKEWPVCLHGDCELVDLEENKFLGCS